MGFGHGTGSPAGVSAGLMGPCSAPVRAGPVLGMSLLHLCPQCDAAVPARARGQQLGPPGQGRSASCERNTSLPFHIPTSRDFILTQKTDQDASAGPPRFPRGTCWVVSALASCFRKTRKQAALVWIHGKQSDFFKMCQFLLGMDRCPSPIAQWISLSVFQFTGSRNLVLVKNSKYNRVCFGKHALGRRSGLPRLRTRN